MTNVLIRGLSEAAVERIDSEAAALGLSRNEFLRRMAVCAGTRSSSASTSNVPGARRGDRARGRQLLAADAGRVVRPVADEKSDRPG